MSGGRVVSAVVGAAGGAALALLLDPQSGRRRRTEAAQRTAAAARRAVRGAARSGRGAVAELDGRRRGAVHALIGRPRPVDDPTLADRVRSELFRTDDIPKGDININVERAGVVVLRGEVQGYEMVRDVEMRVRAIAGVRDVENLLHTPGTPAPMHI